MKLGLSGLKATLGMGGPQVGKVLILDGDNVVGFRIVNLLLKEGETPGVELRVGFRDLPNDDEVAEGWEDVERVKFVWEDEATYAHALKNVTTVFVSTPATHDFDSHFKAFLAACKKAKVHRFIKLSFYHALRTRAENPNKYFGDPDYLISRDNFHDIPLVHQHALCDGDLIVGGVDCTILFASHLMSNVFEFQGSTLKEKHEFYGASGGKGVNYVSPNDVADVAVRAILDPKTHKRQGYTLTGATPITDEEVASLLSNHLETPVTYVDKPLTFFSESSAAFETIKASGLEEENKFITGDFERISGRKPESFADYLIKEETMAPVEKKVFGHTITMVPKIEQDFPEEPHFITMVAKTGQETTAPAEDAPVAAQ
ncbi:hypothetical protein ACHAW6_004601 [Cyclotella cf. meneghiniana]